jgi:hypothetical protein
VQDDLLKICISSSAKESKKVAQGGSTARKLLVAEANCPNGKEPLWSSDLIHKVHILIFLIAVSHVLYALTSLAISLHSIQRWHEYERSALLHGLLDLPVEQLQREGENRVSFGLRHTIRQFTHPIDEATYIALRSMFIENLQVCCLHPFGAAHSQCEHIACTGGCTFPWAMLTGHLLSC